MFQSSRRSCYFFKAKEKKPFYWEQHYIIFLSFFVSPLAKQSWMPPLPQPSVDHAMLKSMNPVLHKDMETQNGEPCLSIFK